MVLKGKSGWCSTVCPLLPVQRIYGQTPFVTIANSHCQPCVGCVKNCYDFNPKAAYLADLNDSDPYWSGYRKLFVGAFPGLDLRVLPRARPPGRVGRRDPRRASRVYMLVSAGSFLILATFFKGSPHKLTTLYGALAFSIFYWDGAPNLYAAWSDGPRARRRHVGPARRVHRDRRRVAAAHLRARRTSSTARRARRRASKIGDVAQRSLAGQRALRAGEPEVSFEPEGKRVVVKPGLSVLEVAEANSLKIEAGCRMGICGADPIAIKDGMENLSAISDDERSTLDRLGLASNTRMACCARVQGPVSVCLTPDKAETPQLSRIQFAYDRSIERVVVDRQRHRRRHRRRPRAPPPPGVRDRHRGRRDAPPLQPHGHLAPDLRALGDAGALPEPRLLVRGARHHDVAEHAGHADRPRRPPGRARHRRACSSTTG